MSQSPNCLWLTCFVMLLSWHEVLLLQCGEWEYLAKDKECAPCTECPRGEEPDRKCGFGKGQGVTCRPCRSGMFSDSYGTDPCFLHTHCLRIKRIPLSFGTSTADSQCGDCIPGFYAPGGDFDDTSDQCLPCSRAPKLVSGCNGFRSPWARPKRTVESALTRESIAVLNSTLTSSEDSRTDYAVLAIVPVFCMMGLLGILLCNLLKKKGYHCTSQKELDEEAAAGEKNASNLAFRADDANEDTIGVLVRLITEKKENAFALEELLKDYHSKQIVPTKTPTKKLYFLPPLPHVCRHQHHLHTVQGPAPRTGPCCTRCSQKKWPEVLLSPEMAAAAAAAIPPKPVKAGPKPGKPGEVTILSVGRFRVARIPEQKANPCEVKTIMEPGGGGINSPCSSPTEQKILLGAGTKTKWPKVMDSKPEVVN